MAAENSALQKSEVKKRLRMILEPKINCKMEDQEAKSNRLVR